MYKPLLLILILLVSCKTQDIKLEVVRKTSDLLHCHIIYGYDAKRLYEQNEILIQVGVIDTTTENPPIETAILNINRAEIVLSLKSDSVLGNRTIQKYSDGSYDLTLDYLTEKNEGYYGSYIYPGTCTITKDKKTSKYDIVGIANPNL